MKSLIIWLSFARGDTMDDYEETRPLLVNDELTDEDRSEQDSYLE